MHKRSNRRGFSAAKLTAISLAAVLLTSAAALRAQTHAGQYEQADIEYGARLYAGHCVTCHGERGDAMPGANLRSGRFRNAVSDRDLTNVVRDGVPGTAMIPNRYSESELVALVAYLRNMNAVDIGDAPAGDAQRGRELFVGKGACTSCHRVAGEGARTGPDLTNVGAIRTAATLRRSLIDPDAAMLPIQRPVRAVTHRGEVITGRRVNEDTFNVQIVDPDGRLRSFEKASLREYTVGRSATMPSYADVFGEEERGDLVAYLLSLKGPR